MPSTPKSGRTHEHLRHSQASSHDSLPRGGRQLSNSPVDIVKRTLQSALSNAQNMFNPAYREFRFKDFSPGTRSTSFRSCIVLVLAHGVYSIRLSAS